MHHESVAVEADPTAAPPSTPPESQRTPVERRQSREVADPADTVFRRRIQEELRDLRRLLASEMPDSVSRLGELAVPVDTMLAIDERASSIRLLILEGIRSLHELDALLECMALHVRCS